MGLDTLTFSFLFLPAVLLCFYLGPARWRNGVLVAASLLFYLCNAPEWLPMMLVSLLLDYLVCAKLVRSTVQMRGRRLVFWLSIIKNLLLMVLSLAMVELFALPLPLGVMVYTTTSMGYVIDVYNGDEYFDGKLVDFLMVTTFFGKLPAGLRFKKAVAAAGNRHGHPQAGDAAVHRRFCQAGDSGTGEPGGQAVD